MGIRDRDYMRRPAPEDEPSGTAASRIEACLSQFIRRHPRFLRSFAIAVGLLILLGLVVILFPGG